ncbi:MAG: phosphoadenosine phosphosulfate reductase family protein [Spongiibacteraceae bacterium]
MTLDLAKINADLKGRPAEDIVRWALGLGKRAFTSTSFSPNSGVMLQLVSRIDPGVPIVWVDSGYNMPDAYQVAEALIEKLHLNMHVYNPLMSAERRNALMGGIPHPDDNPDLHREFTRQVKLEPFQRALADLKPEVWLTGIRRDETEFRKTLDIVSIDDRGLLRVAPLFYWSEQEVADYMRSHNLPTCQHYFDPTKINSDAECGLHTSA